MQPLRNFLEASVNLCFGACARTRRVPSPTGQRRRNLRARATVGLRSVERCGRRDDGPANSLLPEIEVKEGEIFLV